MKEQMKEQLKKAYFKLQKQSEELAVKMEQAKLNTDKTEFHKLWKEAEEVSAEKTRLCALIFA